MLYPAPKTRSAVTTTCQLFFFPFEKINADIYCLANNHTMDAGRKGLEDTLSLANTMGCKTVGAGLDVEDASTPFYLTEAGGIGIIAVGYRPDCIAAGKQNPGVFSWDDMDRIEARIKEIKNKCRWCIIIAHGGEEFAALPSVTIIITVPSALCPIAVRCATPKSPLPVYATVEPFTVSISTFPR